MIEKDKGLVLSMFPFQEVQKQNWSLQVKLMLRIFYFSTLHSEERKELYGTCQWRPDFIFSEKASASI